MNYSQLREEIDGIVASNWRPTTMKTLILQAIDTYLEEKAVEVEKKRVHGGLGYQQYNQAIESAAAIIRQTPTEEKVCKNGDAQCIKGARCTPCFDQEPSAPKDSLEWEHGLDLILGLAPQGTLKYDRAQQIKSFIKEQIAKAKEEERARIRGVIEKHKAPAAFVGDAPGDDAVGSEQRAFGRNCALTDILKEIGE